MVAGATRHFNGASHAVLDGGVRFPSEFFVTVDAFAPGQVLNFKTLAYVANCYSELCPLKEVTLVDNESQRQLPSSLLGANLELGSLRPHQPNTQAKEASLRWTQEAIAQAERPTPAPTKQLSFRAAKVFLVHSLHLVGETWPRWSLILSDLSRQDGRNWGSFNSQLRPRKPPV